MYLQTYRRRDEVIFTVLSFLTFLPLSNRYNLMRIAVVGMCFLLTANYYEEQYVRRIKSLSLKMFLSPILPVLVVMFLDDAPISMGLVRHELMRLIFAIAVIGVAYKLRVSFNCVYRTTIVVFMTNFAIQLCQYNGVSAVYNFIKRYYVIAAAGEWSHLELSLIAGDSFRAGSIYINPNVYMVIPLMGLAVFFQKKTSKDSILNNLLIVCCVISCLLTGSRTAVVVAVAIIAYYYFRYNTNLIKRVFVAIIAISLLYMIKDSTLVGMRAFQLETEDMDSLAVKLNGFIWYWNSANIIYWLTGSLGSTTVAGIDCEWGHIYTWYGCFGLLWYIQYYKLIWNRNNHLVFYTHIIVIVMALTAITASVLLAMQLFTFACVLAFANIIDTNA